jgi:GrpB-like predicted nucleotidyltransferase (UPF0157 family)
LVAKPVVDIMIDYEVDAENMVALLEGVGYAFEAKACDDLLREHYWLRSPAAGARAIQLHLLAADSQPWHERLRFREALRSDPELAVRYSALKAALAQEHADDRSAYTVGKWPFVTEVLRANP